MFQPVKWIKNKFRKKLGKKKDKNLVKDPWGKLKKIKDLKKKSINYPKIPNYPKIRIPGLAYIKMVISGFIFVNMFFLILGMTLNYLPSPMNQYIMWLFVLTAVICLDHIWTKRKFLRKTSLEVSFKEIEKPSKTKKQKKRVKK